MSDLIQQRYKIQKKIGEGGMASVYLAEDTTLGRQVALKMIRVGQIPPDQLPRVMERFRREAQSMSRFTNVPGIVSVHDYGEHEGNPYLVMSYMAGGTLKQRLGTPIPYQKAAGMLLPVAQALEMVHAKGIIHRDIKPSNILIDAQGKLALADFGIAKTLESTDHTLTGTGMGVGTAAYMAPEQWRGKSSPQSDIYSLGVVYYEMITGRKPFEGETASDLYLRIMTEKFPDPRTTVKKLPRKVTKLLQKSMTRELSDRHGEMLQFREDLERFVIVPKSKQKEKPKPVKKVHAEKKTIIFIKENKKIISRNKVPPTKKIEKRKVVKRSVPKPITSRQPSPISEKETIDQLDTASKVQVKPQKSEKKLKVNHKLIVKIGAFIVCLTIIIGVILSINGRNNSDAMAIIQEVTLTPAPPTHTQTSKPTPIATSTFTLTLIPSDTHTSTCTGTTTRVSTPMPTLGIGSTMIREKDGMEMVYVPAGEFTMGSSGQYSDEKPIHEVYLDAYWIDKYEVTNEQYARCVDDEICSGPASPWTSSMRSSYYGIEEYADYPVVYVDWNQSQAYCDWAGGRLPTEAEWEKAARGTDERTYPWGNEKPTCDLVNYSGCVGDMVGVGSYPEGASPYGALDMAGNVWEWVADWYYGGYYSNSPAENPSGPASGSSRVVRGGSWFGNEVYVRSAYRYGFHPRVGWNLFGFRCAMDP